MTNLIYGLDPQKKLTPLMIRDAIVLCFYKAHCADSSLNADDKNIDQEYCKSIIEKGFLETNGDFKKPTKESLIKVLDYLGNFSKNFRDPKIIKNHYKKIMILIEKL